MHDLIPAALASPGVDREHRRLRARARRDLAEQRGPAHCGGVDRDLIRSGAQDRRRKVDRPDPATDAERNAERLSNAPGEVDDSAPPLGRCGDVEEHELVGAFPIVSRRERDRVASVAKLHESRALDHAPVPNIEARDDPLREHRAHPDVALTKE